MNELLEPSRVQYCDDVTSVKRTLEIITDLLCQTLPSVDNEAIFYSLIARERLGSTTLGHGVALPHVRTPAVSKPIGSFVRLAEGIDFGTTDKQSVDLIFGVAIPQDDDHQHLDVIAMIARHFRDPNFTQRLRRLTHRIDLYQAFTQLDHD